LLKELEAQLSGESLHSPLTITFDVISGLEKNYEATKSDYLSLEFRSGTERRLIKEIRRKETTPGENECLRSP
jgi:hypothetical protein